MKFIHDAELTRENIIALKAIYYPIGSGPLACMRQVCKLLDVIAEIKGWDVTQTMSYNEAIESLKKHDTTQHCK